MSPSPTFTTAFIGRVAQGRGMSEEAVDAVARGRVWTGQDAMDMGLVDGMGDLQDASEPWPPTWPG